MYNVILYIFIYWYFSIKLYIFKYIFSVSYVVVPELFCGEVVLIFVILTTILMPTKLPVASVTF